MVGGMKEMANVMSKLLNLGMPLKDIVARSTWRPAQVIKRTDLGHLTAGAVADVTVLRLHRGMFGFLDVRGGRQSGTQKVEAELTARDGCCGTSMALPRRAGRTCRPGADLRNEAGRSSLKRPLRTARLQASARIPAHP
jgi:predicted amidohydrolase